MRRGIRIFLAGIAKASRADGRGGERAPDGIPDLVARAWLDELLAGYRQAPARILKPIAAGAADDLVAARDIEFTSICRHHLLPFSGKVHLAYAPRGAVTGLSSLGRLVDCLSRRLQIQEDLTREIADALQEHLRPAGAACLIEATHTCMTMRGARKTHARVMTTAFTGRFRRSAAGRREVLAILGLAGAGATRARSRGRGGRGTAGRRRSRS
jgi:GTP cyclohydrolase I